MSFFYTPAEAALARNANDFRIHRPTAEAVSRMATIRQSHQRLADYLLTTCPPGRDLTMALIKLKEASMWAVSAIACGEPEAPDPGESNAETEADDQTPN